MHHDPKLGVQLTYINFHPLQKWQSSGNLLLDQKQTEFEKPFEPFLNVAKLPKRSSHSNQFWLLNFGDLHVCNLWDPKKTPFSFRFQNLLLENVEKYLIHLETFQCFFQIVHLKS